MRYVLTRDITPDDLRNFDARNSHFEGTPDKPIRIMGDFAHDFRNCSFAYVIVDGDWSGSQMKWATSFKGDWSRCILPSDFSPVDIDMMRGTIDRRKLILTSRQREVADLLAQYLTQDYLRSYADTRHAAKEAGYSLEEIYQVMAKMFKDYPTILRYRDRTKGTTQAPPPLPTDTALKLEREPVDLTLDMGEDRWAIGQALSTSTLAVWVRNLHPYKQMVPAQVGPLAEVEDNWRWLS